MIEFWIAILVYQCKLEKKSLTVFICANIICFQEVHLLKQTELPPKYFLFPTSITKVFVAKTCCKQEMWIKSIVPSFAAIEIFGHQTIKATTNSVILRRQEFCPSLNLPTWSSYDVHNSSKAYLTEFHKVFHLPQ